MTREPFMNQRLMNMRPAVVVGAMCLLATWASTSAASVTIAVPQDATGAPGGDAEVPISIRGAQGLGALQFELTYDPAVLEAGEVVAGQDIAGVLLESNVVSPGRLRVAMAGNEPMAGDGELTATFAVKAPGTSALALENARAWEQENGLDMLVDVESGQFVAATSSAAGSPVVLLAVVGGIVLLVIIAVLLAGRGKSQRA